MNVIGLIGQRAKLSDKIENKINDIWAKYAYNKFNIYFHNHYAGGVISIFNNAENADYDTIDITDKKSGYIVRIDIDKKVKELYPETLKKVLNEIGVKNG